MKRMIIATIIVVTVIPTIMIGAAIIFRTMEYTIDPLQDVYADLDAEMGYGDSADVNTQSQMLLYFFAACILFLIFMIFLWFFAYAHKKEFEQD